MAPLVRAKTVYTVLTGTHEPHSPTQGSSLSTAISNTYIYCPAGVEPSPRSRENSHISKMRGTNSGTLSVNITRIIAAWPDLPEHIQLAILTLCQLPSYTGGGL